MVQVDDTGHYVLFEASENGRKQMEAYYQAYNDTPMLMKEGHSKWTVQFERRLGVEEVKEVKKVNRTEEEKARRAEKKAKKAAKKESKKRKLEAAEQIQHENQVGRLRNHKQKATVAGASQSSTVLMPLSKRSSVLDFRTAISV